MDTVYGGDDDSMDSETSSMASFRTDRTPATPDEDLDEVRSFAWKLYSVKRQNQDRCTGIVTVKNNPSVTDLN